MHSSTPISQSLLTNHNSRRDSNMELLRIVAMLLVMIVHADFRALNIPQAADFCDDTFRTVMRLAVGSLSVICVNTFVCLSGWFGIRFRRDRILEFLFQICFFSMLGIIISIIMGEGTLTRRATSLLLLENEDYWFVKGYLLMYIFAPVMNSFVEHSTKRQFGIFLILFYVFQSVYGFVGGAEWFRLGYSGISFMGLYMLARYIRLYPNRLTTFNKSWDIFVYLLLAVLNTLICAVVLSLGLNQKIITHMYGYVSPFVIMASVYFLLFFSKLKISYNKVINYVAASCFAIYLVHSNAWLAHYYDHTIQYLFASYRGIAFFIRATLFIAIVFACSILIDKLRILLWKMILFLFQRLKPNQGKQFAGGIKTEMDTPKIEQQANHKEEY